MGTKFGDVYRVSQLAYNDQNIVQNEDTKTFITCFSLFLKKNIFPLYPRIYIIEKNSNKVTKKRRGRSIYGEIV